LAYGKISGGGGGGSRHPAAHVLLITNYRQSTLNMHCQLPRANKTPSIILKAMQGTIKKNGKIPVPPAYRGANTMPL